MSRYTRKRNKTYRSYRLVTPMGVLSFPEHYDGPYHYEREFKNELLNLRDAFRAWFGYLKLLKNEPLSPMYQIQLLTCRFEIISATHRLRKAFSHLHHTGTIKVDYYDP